MRKFLKTIILGLLISISAFAEELKLSDLITMLNNTVCATNKIYISENEIKCYPKYEDNLSCIEGGSKEDCKILVDTQGFEPITISSFISGSFTAPDKKEIILKIDDPLVPHSAGYGYTILIDKNYRILNLRELIPASKVKFYGIIKDKNIDSVVAESFDCFQNECYDSVGIYNVRSKKQQNIITLHFDGDKGSAKVMNVFISENQVFVDVVITTGREQGIYYNYNLVCDYKNGKVICNKQTLDKINKTMKKIGISIY